jgi:hypothetical protein
MSEQERQKKYWYISLFFLVLAAIAGYRLYFMEFQPVFFSRLQQQITSVLFFASLPLSLLFELLLAVSSGHRKSLRLWIEKPSVTGQYQVPRANCSAAIEHRLASLKFQISRKFREADSEYIEFKKDKAAQSYTFLDHGFFGLVELSPAPQGGQITTQLTFDDTLLIETGEMDELRQLADYISLQHDNHTQPRKVSLILYCGLVLAYLTVLGSLCLNPAVLTQRTILTAFANAATLTLIAALVLTVIKRSGLMGYRLGFLGLGLAIVPYIAGFAAYSRF